MREQEVPEKAVFARARAGRQAREHERAVIAASQEQPEIDNNSKPVKKPVKCNCVVQ